ncbi:MAG TPA: hypothetical protein PKE63_00640 [Lacibacter sp.]|nr:hypothetical protein [Lacibacter sp.]HMO90064.1 hypothetical protein [Lacibacter sp.]HMP85749.1 hypothetical protein [Lacibacter sp.]
MRRSCLLLLLLLTGTVSPAQIKTPGELEEKIRGKDRFSEIVRTVDLYYRSKSSEDASAMREWKHWKRWEWFMSRYINADDRLYAVNGIYNQAYQQQMHQQRTLAADGTTGNWTSLGPSSYTHINGLYRGLGRIDRIAFHPTNSATVYVGAPNGGLWRTTNTGTSWQPLSTYGPQLGVSGIVVSNNDPNTLYVLTGDGDSDGFISTFGYRSRSVGIMKSIDAGQNWILQQNGLPTGNWRGYSLCQSPVNPNVLLVATSSGVYRTINAGLNWERVNTGFATDVKFKPGSGTVCYAAGPGWVSYSTNSGSDWTRSIVEDFSGFFMSNRIQLAVTPADNNVVYMLSGPAGSGTFTGLGRSTNSGQNFIRQANTPNILGNSVNGSDDADQSGYDLALAASNTNANTIFTGGLCVWRSTNGGSTLVSASLYAEGTNLSKYIHPDVHDLQVNPLDGSLWAATDGGVYRSVNNGVDWTDLSAGLGTAQPYHLAGAETNPNILYFGCQDNGVKNRGTNSSNWNHIMGADGFDVVIDYNNTNRAWYSVNRTILRTTNAGFSEECASVARTVQNCNSYQWFGNIAQHTTDPNTIFVGYDSVFKSTNSGFSYTAKSASGSWDIVTCKSNSNRIYAAGVPGEVDGYRPSESGRLYRSDDAGENWQVLSTKAGFPASFFKITSIGVNPSNSAQVWVTFSGTTPTLKVYYSADAGETWTNFSTGLPNIPINCIAVTSQNHVYVGTDAGVFYKPNASTVWTPFYNNLPPAPVTELVINTTAGKIRAATFGRGIWESPLYTSCDAMLNVTGTRTGRLLFEAGSQLSSNAIVTGGSGTEIFFRSGNAITLNPGFEVVNNSNFQATINFNCGQGGIPDIRRISAETIDYSTRRLPQTPERLFPYGTVEWTPDGTELMLRVYEPGFFTVQITNEKGEVLQTFAQGVLQPGVHRKKLDVVKNNRKQQYIQLWLQEELVHFQDF